MKSTVLLFTVSLFILIACQKSHFSPSNPNHSDSSTTQNDSLGLIKEVVSLNSTGDTTQTQSFLFDSSKRLLVVNSKLYLTSGPVLYILYQYNYKYNGISLQPFG